MFNKRQVLFPGVRKCVRAVYLSVPRHDKRQDGPPVERIIPRTIQTVEAEHDRILKFKGAELAGDRKLVSARRQTVAQADAVLGRRAIRREVDRERLETHQRVAAGELVDAADDGIGVARGTIHEQQRAGVGTDLRSRIKLLAGEGSHGVVDHHRRQRGPRFGSRDDGLGAGNGT